MEELHEAYRRHGFTAEDFSGPQFVRLRTLSGRMHLLDPARAGDGKVPGTFPSPRAA
jgi:hypothetical protein